MSSVGGQEGYVPPQPCRRHPDRVAVKLGRCEECHQNALAAYADYNPDRERGYPEPRAEDDYSPDGRQIYPPSATRRR